MHQGCVRRSFDFQPYLARYIVITLKYNYLSRLKTKVLENKKALPRTGRAPLLTKPNNNYICGRWAKIPFFTRCAKAERVNLTLTVFLLMSSRVATPFLMLMILYTHLNLLLLRISPISKLLYITFTFLLLLLNQVTKKTIPLECIPVFFCQLCKHLFICGCANEHTQRKKCKDKIRCFIFFLPIYSRKKTKINTRLLITASFNTKNLFLKNHLYSVIFTS